MSGLSKEEKQIKEELLKFVMSGGEHAMFSLPLLVEKGATDQERMDFVQKVRDMGKAVEAEACAQELSATEASTLVDAETALQHARRARQENETKVFFLFLFRVLLV